VVICMDEFGPLNLLPRPGKHWAPVAAKDDNTSGSRRRRRRRATLHPPCRSPSPHGRLRLNQDKIYGHIKTKKDRTTFLEFCRYLRTLYPPEIRIAIVLGQLQSASFHPERHEGGRLGRRQQRRTGLRPTNASWLNRIEAQFQALRYFTLDGTDHVHTKSRTR